MKHTFDEQASMNFLVEQSTHIEREVNEEVYPDVIYPELIPVDTSAHPFVDTITFYSMDKVGQAGWINGNADDVPMADVTRGENKSNVYMAGIGYGYGYEELQKAQMLGVPLTSDKAKAARRAYEEFMQGVALSGNQEKGFTGLFSFPNVSKSAAPKAINDAATNNEIISMFNGLLSGIATDSHLTSLADTVILPLTTLTYLSSRPMGSEGQMTLLEYLRKNNIYTLQTGKPLTIRGLVQAETAGTGGTKLMMAYRRNPQVLKLHIPMPHQFLPVREQGVLRWAVPGVFRTGGAEARRPHEMRYLEGV